MLNYQRVQSSWCQTLANVEVFPSLIFLRLIGRLRKACRFAWTAGQGTCTVWWAPAIKRRSNLQVYFNQTASLPLRLKVCIRKALQQVTPQNQKRNRVVKRHQTSNWKKYKEMERAKKGHPTAAPALMEPSISALRGLQGPPAPLEVSAVPSSCG